MFLYLFLFDHPFGKWFVSKGNTRVNKQSEIMFTKPAFYLGYPDLFFLPNLFSVKVGSYRGTHVCLQGLSLSHGCLLYNS